MMELLNSQDLCKLLYYTQSNPLDQADILDTSALLFNNIYPVPVIAGTTDAAKSFITVIFNNFHFTNTSFKKAYVDFRVISHIDLWKIDNGQLRPYSIMSEIDKIFNNERTIGIGKMQFDDAMYVAINEKFQGYISRYCFYDFS